MTAINQRETCHGGGEMTRSARNILDGPPLSSRHHALLDAGGGAVAVLTLVLFIAPMIVFALRMANKGAHGSPAFELRMLLWSALLALVLPLVQIVLQIRRHGGGAVRGNRARFSGGEGAAGRLVRAHRNLIEALMPFAVVVIAAQASGISTRWTAAASVTFLAARLVHAASYAFGITVIRSAAFYAGVIATAVIGAQTLLSG